MSQNPPPASVPVAPLSPAQQRLLAYFMQMNSESRNFLLNFAEGMAEEFPVPVPKRAFRVIAGGVS